MDTRLAYQLQEDIDEKIRQGHHKFLVDLTDLDYISSARIGVFSTIILQSQKQHGRIIFVHLPESVDTTISHLTRLIKIFTIVETEQNAIQ
ncbi:hypothetical protein CSA56_12500 [candidate division KSB3 bacterium]|uniref:STAS domain-containing protein n=1 Tax=candidate division KSB3 bacterium TaxID=2044937 RepID=A0A2G6KE98_9BACT|nr:MAG: hypothetical protein CSA56_12500 [candidate division KSB3 bacterium]